MKDDGSPARYSVQIGGSVSGQVAAGTDIVQTFTAMPAEPAGADIAELLADLRRIVADEAPVEQRDAALDRVDELGEAITAEQPNVTTMAYVWDWFTRRVPHLAHAVNSAIVSPLVTSLVDAAGAVVAAQFKNTFGL